MKKKKHFSFSTESHGNYNVALLNYHPELLENEATTPTQIYEYYSYVDKLYVWLKNAYDDNLCVLCNEMRAITGHLAEYNENTEGKCHNLAKAYGHSRRLSIDTLKIACNGFDLEFDKWIRKHSCYDCRNIDAEYLPKYIELYYIAHNKYLEAQKAENLGSDRGNNIIQKYYDVAVAYCDLYELHVKKERYDIEKNSRRLRNRKLGWIIGTSVIAILSCIGMFL